MLLKDRKQVKLTNDAASGIRYDIVARRGILHAIETSPNWPLWVIGYHTPETDYVPDIPPLLPVGWDDGSTTWDGGLTVWRN